MTTKKQNIPPPPFEVGTRLRYNGEAEIDFNGALFCPGTTVTIERTHAGDMYISDDGIEVIRPGTSTYFLSGRSLTGFARMARLDATSVLRTRGNGL